MRSFRDRGEGAVSYLAVLLLVGGATGALVTSDVGAKVARACEQAICKVSGGSCPGDPARSGLASRPQGPGEQPNAKPLLLAGPSGPVARRPPIPKKVCAPNPGAGWAEGLHAHNDYENQHPLKDALNNGATSVEVDTAFGVNGKIEVKHHPDTTGKKFGDRNPTLKDLYIDPLMERLERNGGVVYPGRNDPKKPFQLVIELKRQYPDGEPGKVRTPQEIQAASDKAQQELFWTLMRDTEELRTRYPNVEVVISGGRPGDVVGKPDPRTGKVPQNVVYDIPPGPGCTIPKVLDPDAPRGPNEPPYNKEFAQNFAVLNGEWPKCGDRNGDGKVSPEEQRNLDAVVQRAHDLGLTVRLWGGPESKGGRRDSAWRAMQQAGVDHLSTDHLKAGRDWIRNCGPKPKKPQKTVPPQPTIPPVPTTPPGPVPPPQPTPAPSPRPR